MMGHLAVSINVPTQTLVSYSSEKAYLLNAPSTASTRSIVQEEVSGTLNGAHTSDKPLCKTLQDITCGLWGISPGVRGVLSHAHQH